MPLEEVLTRLFSSAGAAPMNRTVKIHSMESKTATPDPEPPPDIDVPIPDPFIPETPDPHNDIGSTYDEVGNILYWYNIQHKDGDMKLVMVETTHHDCMKQMLYMEVRDPRVPCAT